MDTTTPTTDHLPSGDPAGRVDADRTLTDLLDAELTYRPEARSGFISHLAMGLVALRRLGASAAELHDFFEAEEASGYLIARARPAWLGPDTERIAHVGIGQTVAAALPELLHAPGSQFFHAPIRLELAIDAAHPGQVANALANWREAEEPLPHLPAGEGASSFIEVIDQLADAVDHGAAQAATWTEVASAPEFRRVIDQLAWHEGLLDEVATFVAEVHVDPRHFGTLHLVTGVRAMQALAPLVVGDDRRMLALRTAQAVAVAQASFGGVTRPTPGVRSERRADPQPGWDDLARAAIATGDAHTAKLTYACWLEEARTGDPIYRDLAGRQSAA